MRHCLSEVSLYLTGGDVNIFMLCTLIGFLLKYSMVFLRNKIFYFSITRWLSLLVLAVGCCTSPKHQSFYFQACTDTKSLKLRSLANLGGFFCISCASYLVCIAEISFASLPSKCSILSCIHAKTWWKQGSGGPPQARHPSASVSHLILNSS